ncbi:PQQ-dependent sugar dehydrogenase [Rhizobium leguminosarum]|uniref:PQQ-dependent sugar dehydrogenase n=1 Tax=Rhizobium leguminosarum TaxID=384 RepID=UPI00315D131D
MDREPPETSGYLEPRGKILRMTIDGKVPDDNPFPGSYVYSLGHRNPQGIAWSPDGRLFVAEHGQSANDEINLIVAGQNYGWPVVSGDEERRGMEGPLLHSGNNTWAPSGIAFAGDELLVSALVGKGLYVFDAAENSLKPIFTSGDRLRDVLPVGQDIYVVTHEPLAAGGRSLRRPAPETDADKIARPATLDTTGRPR